MKTLSEFLQAHLDTGATTLAWCWRLMRADGHILGFTDHDYDIAFAGTIYQAASGFSGTDIHTSLGLSVDNLDVTGALASSHLNEDDLVAGLFDNAGVEIWRVNWRSPEQRVLMMSGTVGEVRRDGTAFTAELRSLAHYLSQEQGRVYQYACDATLGDARCGVSRTISTGTVTDAATAHLFTANDLGDVSSGHFMHGLVTWQTGGNSARVMEVKRHTVTADGHVIELWRSMPSTIQLGDTFHISAGCDKTISACHKKFDNVLNFRGFPHIPGNGYLLAVPAPGGLANNGGSISE